MQRRGGEAHRARTLLNPLMHCSTWSLMATMRALLPALTQRRMTLSLHASSTLCASNTTRSATWVAVTVTHAIINMPQSLQWASRLSLRQLSPRPPSWTPYIYVYNKTHNQPIHVYDLLQWNSAAKQINHENSVRFVGIPNSSCSRQVVGDMKSHHFYTLKNI
jgi:hypothetical protein